LIGEKSPALAALNFAQRARWAAAMRLRAAADNVRLPVRAVPRAPLWVDIPVSAGKAKKN